MPRRILTDRSPRLLVWPFLALLFSALAATLCAPTTASAQQPVRIPSPLQVDDAVAERLSQGDAMEQEGRWGEALSHYDSLLREFPEQQEIEDRRSIARIHFDLSRRFSDRTFLQRVGAITRNEALTEYSEVLQKIHTHHVDSPNWREIVLRGNEHLATALSDKTFREAHRLEDADLRIPPFLAELQRMIDARPIRNDGEARYTVDQVAQLAQDRLNLPASSVIQEYTCSAVGSLDHYSAYLTGSQLDDIYSQIEGNFVGLGIELKTEDDAILIVHVIPGSPAERSGIAEGDRIVQVDGQSVREVSGDVAADMLKGEEGSQVDLVVVSAEGISRELRVLRQRVDVPSVVNVELIDQELGIAYLKITSFQKTTTRDLDAALWELHRSGMRSLVLDVRGNPGGLLTASVEIADRFLSEGTIVSTRGRAAREDFDYRAHQAGTWRVPLVVLIDTDSASASEILAGAIHDHRRGTVVGQRSYGKGSVQGIFPLTGEAGGVRLTTAKFYSPSGQAISHRGINPDVVVHSTARPTSEGWVAVDGDVDGNTPPRDATLEAGLQVAREQLTRRP